MAEKAAILGGMAVGQRGHAVIVMACAAELFGFLFAGDFMELLMVVVMGQARGGLVRGKPEEQEDAAADY